jgi:hypothetical protein
MRVVVHTCDLRTQEMETEGSQVPISKNHHRNNNPTIVIWPQEGLLYG